MKSTSIKEVTQLLRAMLISRHRNQTMVQLTHAIRVVIMKTLVDQTAHLADARPVNGAVLDK